MFAVSIIIHPFMLRPWQGQVWWLMEGGRERMRVRAAALTPTPGPIKPSSHITRAGC